MTDITDKYEKYKVPYSTNEKHSPDEFDPKPGVPNKQMNLSKSSGNKKSVLPPTPKSDLSDKSGIKIISTKKKTKSIPDQHNLSS